MGPAATIGSSTPAERKRSIPATPPPMRNRAQSAISLEPPPTPDDPTPATVDLDSAPSVQRYMDMSYSGGLPFSYACVRACVCVCVCVCVCPPCGTGPSQPSRSNRPPPRMTLPRLRPISTPPPSVQRYVLRKGMVHLGADEVCTVQWASCLASGYEAPPLARHSAQSGALPCVAALRGVRCMYRLPTCIVSK